MPPVEQELLTLLEHLSSPPVLSGVYVAWSLILCVMFCRSLFVLLSFFFWSLCCLSFDLRILITSWLSSNSSQQIDFLKSRINPWKVENSIIERKWLIIIRKFTKKSIMILTSDLRHVKCSSKVKKNHSFFCKYRKGYGCSRMWT